MRRRRRARRRLRGRLRGSFTAPAGIRSRAPRRPRAEGCSRTDARSQRDQLRGRRSRARALHHRRERQPLPDPAGDALRREARRRGSTRTRCTSSRRDMARSTSTSACGRCGWSSSSWPGTFRASSRRRPDAQRSYATSPASTKTRSPVADVQLEATIAVDARRDAARAVHGDVPAAEKVARPDLDVHLVEPAVAPLVVEPLEPEEQRAEQRRAFERLPRDRSQRCRGRMRVRGSCSRVWLTLRPMPSVTTPSRSSPSTPHTLRRLSMTSFGHLICAASPVAPSTASAAAIAPTSVSSGASRSAGGWRSDRAEQRGAGRGLPDASVAAAARSLESVAATAPSGASLEQ